MQVSEEKGPRWVERVRYSESFKSAEEAERFLDEQLRWFDDIHREIRDFWRRMDRIFERAFEPFFTPYRERAPDLLGRVERIERDLAEVKELLKGKYIKEELEKKKEEAVAK